MCSFIVVITTVYINIMYVCVYIVTFTHKCNYMYVYIYIYYVWSMYTNTYVS